MNALLSVDYLGIPVRSGLSVDITINEDGTHSLVFTPPRPRLAGLQWHQMELVSRNDIDNDEWQRLGWALGDAYRQAGDAARGDAITQQASGRRRMTSDVNVPTIL